MNKSIHSQCDFLLSELEAALVETSLWSETTPSDAALNSTQPFCCDTLKFEQWLQFVFIKRLRFMIENKQALPSKILVKPMAEESFKHLGVSVKEVLEIIDKIDSLLSSHV